MYELWSPANLPPDKRWLRAERRRKLGTAAMSLTVAAVIATGSYAAANVAEGSIGVHASATAPNTLPPAVARMANNAVLLVSGLAEVETTSSAAKKSTKFVAMQVSGAYIRNGEILSAGHSLRTPDNKLISGFGYNACGGYSINGLIPSGAAYTTTVNKAISQYTGNNKIDHAMLKMSAESMRKLAKHGVNLDSLPDMKIAEHPPQEGEIVYFINWEPTDADEERDPTSLTPKLAKPAVYAGVVTKIHGTYAEIVTGFKSYDDGGITDERTNGGGSGGIVLNGYGELIGMSDVTNSTSAIMTWIRQAAFFKLGPFGLPDNGKYVTNVDLVTRSEIRNWSHEVQLAPFCPGSDLPGYPMVFNADPLSFSLTP